MSIDNSRSTALPPGTCLLHGSFAGPYCPGCSTVVPIQMRRPYERPYEPHAPWLEPRDYGTRLCPLCDGRGLNPKLPWLTCPKCNGEKRVASAR
jgi:hypothetical protein